MPLREFVQLWSKEGRELLALRSYWLLLVMVGPLVGHAFITAMSLYAETSGSGSGPAALPQGLTPLDGILVPTFGAYDLAATLLLPFVAIGLISSEKQNGGLKLLLQLPGSLAAKITTKGAVLLVGWFLAAVPGVTALILWKANGGHLHAPETLNLALGHVLRMMLSSSIAMAAAAIAENAASAAIVTLGITLGTWALDFIAAGRGGLLQRLAAYTPSAALRTFEQGLLSLNTTVAMLLFIAAGFVLTMIWLPTGRRVGGKLLATLGLAIVLTASMLVAAGIRSSWDLSENRRSSFSPADEAALAQIARPLRITVFLAPEDPRLTDFEQNILRKLKRNLSRLDVEYVAGSRSGLFETDEDHYGEIWYEMGGQKIMERSTIDEVVLEQIFRLAGTTPNAPATDSEFPGYPLAAQSRWAPWIFYAVWPLLVILAWWLIRR